MLSMSLCQLRLGSCHVDQLAWHTMARKHVAACSMVNNVALARCHMWPGVRAHSHARHHALSELPPHTRDALKAVQLLSTRLGPSQEERELVEKLQGAVWKVQVDGSVGKGTFVPGSDLDLVIITGKNMVPTRRDTARVHNSVHMKLEEIGLDIQKYEKNDRALIFEVANVAGLQLGMDIVFDNSTHAPAISKLPPGHSFSPAVQASVKLLKHTQQLRKASGCGVPHLPGHAFEAICCGTERHIVKNGLDPQGLLGSRTGVPGAVLFLAVLQLMAKSSLHLLNDVAKPYFPEGCHLYNLMTHGQCTAWQGVASNMLDVWDNHKDNHSITIEGRVTWWLGGR